MSWGSKLKGSFHLSKSCLIALFVGLAVLLFVNPVFAFQPTAADDSDWSLSSDELSGLVGPLLKSDSSSAIYYMEDGIKRPIPTTGDLQGLGIESNYNILSAGLVDSVPTGDPLYGGGSLIKSDDSSTIYAVNEWENAPSVFRVKSTKDTRALGLRSKVQSVSSSQLEDYELDGDLETTIDCGSNTYVGTLGTLYKLDPSLYNDFDYTADDFIDGGSICNRFEFSNKPLTQFIKYGKNTYYLEDGIRHGFTSYAAFKEMGGTQAKVVKVSRSYIRSFPRGARLQPESQNAENEIQADLFNRVNAERTARGLPKLGWNSYLNNNARSWSVHMARTNSFAHSNIYPLLNTFYVAAENIGLAGEGAKSGAIHVAWMNSTGHRVNLLGRNLDVIGIGVYCAPDGRMWVTQQFGRWPGSSLPTTFGPTPSVNPIVKNDGGGPTC